MQDTPDRLRVKRYAEELGLSAEYIERNLDWINLPDFAEQDRARASQARAAASWASLSDDDRRRIRDRERRTRSHMRTVARRVREGTLSPSAASASVDRQIWVAYCAPRLVLTRDAVVPARRGRAVAANGRERRDGSTRHSTRGGPQEDDSEHEPPTVCPDCGRTVDGPSQDCPVCEADWLSRHGRCANPDCGALIVGRRSDAATCGLSACRRYWAALQKRRQRARPAPLDVRRGDTGSVGALFRAAEWFREAEDLRWCMRQPDIAPTPRGRVRVTA